MAANVRLLALLVLASALPAAALELESDGRHVRDAQGRVVLLRGINYSGLEFGNFPGQQGGPEEADFDQMASWGVNVIRLPIAWSYLEPYENVLDEGYLARHVDPVVSWAGARDMAVVIEMHQFLWSSCVGGLGVPAWSCEGAGYPQGAQGAFEAQSDFWNGALAPDGRPLLDHLLDAWDVVIRHYRSWPSVVGFDFFNEPLDIENITGFEHDALYPFYRRAVARVRAQGAAQMIVLEPPVTRNLGIGAQPEPVGDANLLYAPHLYTVTGGLDTLGYDGDRPAVDADYELAAAEAQLQAAVLWPGEHGGNADGFLAETELFSEHTLSEQDARLAGGAAWAYFPGGNGFSVVEADGSEKGGTVDALVRPFPMQTAGIPQGLRFDPLSGELLFVFDEDPLRGIPDPTILFLPLARHYPDGVEIELSAGDSAVLDVARQRLLVTRDLARERHVVRVRARPGMRLSPPLLPAAQEGMPYAAAIVAQGGSPPYTFAVTGGSLPAGLALSATGGLAGTPAAPGIFRVRLEVSDGAGARIARRLTLLVNAAACGAFAPSPAELLAGDVAVPYAASLAATGGAAPVALALDRGTFPLGLDMHPDGRVTGAAMEGGRFTAGAIAVDADGCFGIGDASLDVGSLYVAGMGAGEANPPRIRTFDGGGLPEAVDLLAFAGAGWGVRVGAANVDGAAHDELLAGPGPGPGHGSHVKACRRDGSWIPRISFFAYGTVGYGASPAGGDVDGDGADEILTAPGPGLPFGPHVRGFEDTGSGTRPVPGLAYYAYGTLRYGASIASGDLRGDVREDLVTAPGPGPTFAPTVRAWRYDGTISAHPGTAFDAFPDPRFGATVAAADTGLDAAAEIAAAPGPGVLELSRFRAFTYDGTQVAPLAGFDVVAFPSTFGGRVGLGDVGVDGGAELLAGPGPDPAAAATVRTYRFDGAALALRLPLFDAFAPASHGLSVQAGRCGDR